MADEKQAAKPRRRLGLDRCAAAGGAGFVTGLLAGLAVAIPLGKEIEEDLVRWVVLGLLCLLAALGGMYAGLVAAGCFVRDD